MEFLEKKCQNEENSSKIVSWDKKKKESFKMKYDFVPYKLEIFEYLFGILSIGVLIKGQNFVNSLNNYHRNKSL